MSATGFYCDSLSYFITSHVKDDPLDLVFLYDKNTLDLHAETRLSPGDCLLFAIINGGDYTKAGLAQAGPKLALVLCKYGIGKPS